jgi:glycosyltransferase involved in cell wall biosynthesis
MMQAAESADVPPLVSIGMPVFNGEKLIREAIDSVLAQDGVTLEVVISDNASTDGTRAICEEYVRRDARVRYHRNPENLGLSGNLMTAAALARGRYFTWLAHDDSLGGSDYLAALTGFLETHPDVVLCGSAMRVFDDEDPGRTTDRVLDAIRPDRDWREARLEFFRWPQPESHWVLYGVYRREALLQVPLQGRTHRGMPVAMDVEYPILARLCGYGRIVALPQVLRNSRSVADSTACREVERFSRLDYLCLALKMKLTLLAVAARMALPAREKLRLLMVTIGNFGRAPLGQRPRFTRALKDLRREVAMLRGVCDERLDIIRRLEGQLEKQRTLIDSLDRQHGATQASDALLESRSPPE